MTLPLINKTIPPVRPVATNQLAYSVLEACQAARIGRTNLYGAIRSGELRAVEHGKRTLILAEDLRRWLESLPAVTPKTNP
ncbi:MAG: helix-turn-helix domain-containing protein [Pseudolabrys sp.]